MPENLIQPDQPITLGKNQIKELLRYWKLIIDFSVKNNKYEDLIYVIEQLKVSKLSRFQYSGFHCECLCALIKLISHEDIEDDVDPRMDSLFNALRKLSIDYSSDEYVLLFNRFHKYSKNWSGYDKFLNWWQVDKINLRFSSKLIYSNVFRADLTIRESYFLVNAVTYIRKNKVGKKLSKRESNRLNKSLGIIRSLNHTDRTSIKCYKIEGHIHLLLSNQNVKDEFILRCLRRKVNRDWMLGYIAKAMKDRLASQLNLVCYLASNTKSLEFKIRCLRVMLPIYNQIDQRVMARSASFLILGCCRKNGFPIQNSDYLEKSIDDIISRNKPSKEMLLKDIKNRYQKIKKMIYNPK